MEKSIIRIQQIELHNFKNIENGSIEFPSYLKEEYYNGKSEIIGLYGQNGSGKTALVDAMWILKNALMGKKLPENTADYILKTSLTSELNFVFYLEKDAFKAIVFYEIELSRLGDKSVQITKEKLSYKKYEAQEWKKKSAIIDYDSSSKETIFKPSNNFKLLVSGNSNNHLDIGVSKKLSEKNMTSFIFSDETEEVIKRSKAFEAYTKIILALKYYANINLFVFQNYHAGLIDLNLFMPLSFRLDEGKNFTQRDLGIGLLEPTVISKNSYEIVTKLIKQMNIVLKTIIPGLNIDIKDYGDQLKEDGLKGIRIELVSVRGAVTIPLRYESEGIKKIISILSSLIALFNKPSVCVVVDELDAGVFEYLLGEILQIISESGKGQLIFSSHNLRPLEMLDSNALVFTTTNPKNRYIRFLNIKSNNNLRNLYFRSINLGGQKENIYDETNSYEISHAFKVAGRVLDEN